MTNFQIYKKTLPFSFIKFAVDLFALLVVIGCAVGGFFILNRSPEMALLGLFIGLIVGISLTVVIEIFLSNRVKAAHIAMITKGISEDKLPDHTVKEGFNELKGRFGKITVFYLITRAIKGVFNQIGSTINKIGTAVGGNTGNAVTSAINTGIQIVVGYLCDCCLGWVLYRKDINSFKAGCEGAVIFFKHGKTLIRNIGRIFGMGLLSLVLFGGAFFGLLVLLFLNLPAAFQNLSQTIVDLDAKYSLDLPDFISNPTLFSVVSAAIIALVLWLMLHSVVARPFILVGVMRNFMEAGKAHIPTDAEFQEVAGKSPKFAKLMQKAQ